MPWILYDGEGLTKSGYDFNASYSSCAVLFISATKIPTLDDFVIIVFASTLMTPAELVPTFNEIYC